MDICAHIKLESGVWIGREIVIFPETGKKYFVEYIDKTSKKVKWGDVDPSTGKLQGKYGTKSKGSIKNIESLITKENGFEEINEGDGSPYEKIRQLHEQRKLNN